MVLGIDVNGGTEMRQLTDRQRVVHLARAKKRLRDARAILARLAEEDAGDEAGDARLLLKPLERMDLSAGSDEVRVATSIEL
ncbi:hypothetical protein JNB_02755 [Janibacter sp. HTCC2649]|nr:hypothetical protein JNB_02755 [Janibacter sp. HTCC2649]